MENLRACPECGAKWREGKTCRDAFEQLLAWDFQDFAGAGRVHHLTGLCYHLQHPSLYSPEGLAAARSQFAEFVEHGTSPVEVRRRDRRALDSGNRSWRFRGAAGSYGRPVHWPITVVDVAAGDLAGYPDRVVEWARAVHEILKPLR